MAKDINFGERRERFMSTFADDPVLAVQLPELAMELFSVSSGSQSRSGRS